MNSKKAFSLAEALITLLIVCIITIISVPVLTKKKRDNPMKVLWIPDTQIKTAIRPTAHRDIILGEENGKNHQGIVVINKMYFKDRNGNIIGWIAEDGSTSFSQGNDYDFNAMSQRQQKLEQMIELVTNMLQQEIQNQRNTQRTHSAKKNTYNRQQNVNEDELNAMMEELLKSMQQQSLQR